MPRKSSAPNKATKKPAAKLPPGLDLSRPTQPRWQPSPRLRRAGWTGTPLRHPDGSWFSLGAAVDAAEAINRLVADWQVGIPLDPQAVWIRSAPSGALGTPVANLRADSIGALLDAYRQHRDFRDLSPTTRRGYVSNLKRMIDILAGYKTLPARSDKAAWTAWQNATQMVRAQSVAELCDHRNPLRMVYESLVDTHRTQANAIMRTAGLWIEWIMREHPRLMPTNPTRRIKRKSTAGRVCVWGDNQIKAVVERATASGYTSVALIMRLGLELSWSQKDLLQIQIQQIQGTRVRGSRAKTNNLVHTTLTHDGQAVINEALALAQARAEAEGRALTPFCPLFVVDDAGQRDRGQIGKPWSSDYFRKVFIAIRRAAGVHDRTFADLRDTAITRMTEAGLSVHEIQSRSQHSLTQIRNILDKHYGLTTTEISDSAAEKLNARNVGRLVKIMQNNAK